MIEKVLKSQVTSELDKARVEFGLAIIRNEIPKFILLFLLFGIGGRLGELGALLFFLLPIRAAGGGLHVRTLAGCVAVTVLYCLMILLLALAPVPLSVNMGALGIAVVLFLLFAPAVNEKRRSRLNYDKARLRRVVRLILLVDIVAMLFLIRYAPVQYANIGTWALLIQSLQLPVIRLKERRHQLCSRNY